MNVQSTQLSSLQSPAIGQRPSAEVTRNETDPVAGVARTPTATEQGLQEDRVTLSGTEPSSVDRKPQAKSELSENEALRLAQNLGQEFTRNSGQVIQAFGVPSANSVLELLSK